MEMYAFLIEGLEVKHVTVVTMLSGLFAGLVLTVQLVLARYHAALVILIHPLMLAAVLHLLCLTGANVALHYFGFPRPEWIAYVGPAVICATYALLAAVTAYGMLAESRKIEEDVGASRKM